MGQKDVCGAYYLLLSKAQLPVLQVLTSNQKKSFKFKNKSRLKVTV